MTEMSVIITFFKLSMDYTAFNRPTFTKYDARKDDISP